MAEFKVKTALLQSTEGRFSDISRQLSAIENDIRSVANNLSFEIAITQSIRSNLNSIASGVDKGGVKVQRMSKAIEQVAREYQGSENKIKGNNTSIWSAISYAGEAIADILGPGSTLNDILNSDFFTQHINPLIQVLPQSGSLVPLIGISNMMNDAMQWFNNLSPSDQSVVQSLTSAGMFSSLVSAGSQMFGVSGSAEGDLLTGSTDVYGMAGWDLEKGNAGIKGGVSAEGHVATGSVSGDAGFLHGEAEVSAINGSAKGEVGLTLFEDGEFQPRIGAEAEAKVSVLEGSAEGRIGSEDYNYHVGADGTLLGAEAKAEVGAGKIVGDDGEVSYGVVAEVGAEAYVAEGEISGGWTFMGIEIDASLSGKFAGAGASAGGSITTEGVSGNVDLGLGVGAGVEISIDWSDFDPKWPWEDWSFPW